MAITKQSLKKAHQYLDTVKDRFRDNREIFDTFIQVMYDLKCKRVGDRYVKSSVLNLFKGHEDLILGYNKFMPKCYRITLKPDRTPLLKSKFQKADDFLDRVQAKLQEDEFESFSETMEMYRQKKKSVTMVLHEVFYGLLRDHHDLRVEFAYFAPRIK